MNLLPYTVGEREYTYLGYGLLDITSLLDQQKISYALTPMSNKLQILAIQHSFDWLNKVL